MATPGGHVQPLSDEMIRLFWDLSVSMSAPETCRAGGTRETGAPCVPKGLLNFHRFRMVRADAEAEVAKEAEVALAAAGKVAEEKEKVEAKRMIDASPHVRIGVRPHYTPPDRSRVPTVGAWALLCLGQKRQWLFNHYDGESKWRSGGTATTEDCAAAHGIALEAEAVGGAEAEAAAAAEAEAAEVEPAALLRLKQNGAQKQKRRRAARHEDRGPSDLEEAAAREAEKAKEVKYMQWLSEAVGTFESIGGCISVYQLVSPDSPFDLSKIPTGKKGDVRRILRSLHRVLADLRQYVMTIPEQGNETPARTHT